MRIDGELESVLSHKINRFYAELRNKKLKEAELKYENDPKFIKAIELAKEISELRNKEHDLAEELRKYVNGRLLFITDNYKNEVINALCNTDDWDHYMQGVIEKEVRLEIHENNKPIEASLTNLKNIIAEEVEKWK